MTSSWNQKVVFMTGGSRGIGRAIALRLAHAGAKIAIAAKTDTPHARLKGTIHSVADEIRAAGGEALPLRVDARNEEELIAAIQQTVETFGRLDAVINNAGFLGITPVAATTTKAYDLMHALNARAPMIVMREALPHLAKTQGRVLNLCPPINLDPGWLGAFAPYTATKYSMTLLSLGFAEETRSKGIHVSTLWPATLIATDAVGVTLGQTGLSVARTPDIMADAAWALFNGQGDDQVCWLDEDLLRRTGVTDFLPYAQDPARAGDIQRDFYVGPYTPEAAS